MGPPRGGDQLAMRFDDAVAIHDSPVRPPPTQRKKKGKYAAVRVVKVDDDDDCVILDGDPHSHRPVAVAGAKGRGAGDGGGSDEVEIVAVKGEVYELVPLQIDDIPCYYVGALEAMRRDDQIAGFI
jgi:hypothetical protein